MNRAFIVMRKGYEYDDSIYTESDGGNPQIVTFSKEDAERIVDELNIKEYMDTDISQYGYEVNDYLNVDWDEFEEFNKSLVTKYGEIPKKYKWEDSSLKLHPKADKDEIEKYLSMVSISFYEVVEVDVDQSSYRNETLDKILE
jgi:hypothetical protein